MNSNTKQLSPEQGAELISLLRIRFEKNKNRHPDIEWLDTVML